MSDEVYQIWLQRAKSNLSRAELGRQRKISSMKICVSMHSR